MMRRGVLFSERGATAVEFALILPLMLVLIFALVDFGRIGYTQIMVASVANDGARLSSLDSAGVTDSQNVVDFVQSSALDAAKIAQLGGSGALTVTVTKCSSTASSENTLVTASTNFKWLLPVGLLSLVTNGAASLDDFTISSTGTMRCMN